MRRIIIAIYGRAREGKSQTIRGVYNRLRQLVTERDVDVLQDDGDILAIIRLDGVVIGIESQGDPNSRMIRERTVRQLALRECDIILCASRTEGMTVREIDDVGDEFEYNRLWRSSYDAHHYDPPPFEIINGMAADEIMLVIRALINRQF
ncbi:hypothetical protein ACI6Q2_13570 [Chitinophagaceae bacterium LWZ2-11]